MEGIENALCSLPQDTWTSPLDGDGNVQEPTTVPSTKAYMLCSLLRIASGSLLLTGLLAGCPRLFLIYTVGVLSLPTKPVLHAMWSNHWVPSHLNVLAHERLSRSHCPPPTTSVWPSKPHKTYKGSMKSRGISLCLNPVSMNSTQKLNFTALNLCAFITSWTVSSWEAGHVPPLSQSTQST